MEHSREIEVVAERGATGFGFIVRARANDRLHRIIPLRDPQQPRFWCVVIFRCSSAGVPDADGPVWIGPRGLERGALKETLTAMQADPAAWLAEPAQHALRTWMVDPAATAPPSAQASRSASRNLTTN
jgi:hypothetical protein